MFKRKLEDIQIARKKASKAFRKEWLTKPIDTIIPSSIKKQSVNLGEIFNYDEENGTVFCIFCAEAKVTSEFSAGKKWDDWKLDYLKRHLNHKVHLDAVTKLYNIKKGGIVQLLSETTEERHQKKERSERLNSDFNSVKVLIQDVILGIKINASMNAIKHIHDHMEKFIDIPKNWRSKNYAFEFVDCINCVIEKEAILELRESRFHTLIVDESTDISVQKVLILYFKFLTNNKAATYKTIFGGLVKLIDCDSVSIVNKIKEFYTKNDIDIKKMVMITSDGASVMLGKKNGVAAILKKELHHLCEQHCVAHREDLGLDDAWSKVSVIREVETLLRTVYTMFSRSAIKKGKFQELAEISERDVVSFRPLNEVRWLSRHFALEALIRNYDCLKEYCEEQIEEANDPICRYILQILNNPLYRVALLILNDVLNELSSLCKYLQKSNLNIIDAHHYVKAKINKLRCQYLGKSIFWNENVRESVKDIDTSAIIRFIERVCNHLDERFPDDELNDWEIFDIDIIKNQIENFDFGKESLSRLAGKYAKFFSTSDVSKKLFEEFSDVKYLIVEKTKAGIFKTFDDSLKYVLSSNEFETISLLYHIMGTFQASSADCERGFSTMNSIKTENRNRLSIDHLSQLLRIKLYLASELQINVDHVYKEWYTTKDRRQKQ